MNGIDSSIKAPRNNFLKQLACTHINCALKPLACTYINCALRLQLCTLYTNIQAWCVHLSTYVSTLLFMQLITNVCVMTLYILSYMVRCTFQRFQLPETPVLTVESPESTAMLTAAGNHQLKRIRLNRIRSIHKTFT